MITNIDDSGLNKVGNNMISLSEQFANLIQQLKQVIQQLIVSWNGEDAIKYINLFNEEYLPRLTELKTQMEVQGEYVMKIPTIYKTFDSYFCELAKIGDDNETK